MHSGKRDSGRMNPVWHNPVFCSAQKTRFMGLESRPSLQLELPSSDLYHFGNSKRLTVFTLHFLWITRWIKSGKKGEKTVQ